MFKRLFDFIAAFCGLLIASPLLIIISIWVKFDSKGPMFYCLINKNWIPEELLEYPTFDELRAQALRVIERQKETVAG